MSLSCLVVTMTHGVDSGNNLVCNDTNTNAAADALRCPVEGG